MPEVQVLARYRVARGNEQAVRSLLAELAAASRDEPGNIAYAAHVQLDDERSIVLLERYVSREALAEHRATRHFRELVLEQIVPLLESRTVEEYEAPAGG